MPRHNSPQSSSVYESILLPQRHVRCLSLLHSLHHQPFIPTHTSCFCLSVVLHLPSCFSCCSVASIRLKIAAALSSPSPFRFYNANVETLLESNNMGGAGFSGISANFYPWLHARLCSSEVSEHDKAKIQRFLSVAEVCGTMCTVVPRLIRCRLLSATVIRNRPKRKTAPLNISALHCRC